MVFKTTGNKSNSVILFFHAMGVTGESSMPVAEKMKENITVLCQHQPYIALDRDIKVKEMRYSKLYDFWKIMESKR